MNLQRQNYQVIIPPAHQVGAYRPISYEEYRANQQTFRQKIPFFEFVEVKLREAGKPEYYKLQLSNVIKTVAEYCQLIGLDHLYISEIDDRFVEGYVFHLTRNRGLMVNTIKGMVQKFTYFLTLARQEGLQVSPSYMNVKIDDENTSGIYLTRGEITRLYYYKGLKKKREEIRDLFILGCCIGMRYSDYSTLTPNNFLLAKRQVQKKTKKTGAYTCIPMHDYVVEIIDKYGGLPPVRCVQYFNKTIKEICKEVGFNEPVYWERTVGGEVVCKEINKWQMVSSHTARRSFATNMYLEGDIPTYKIMAFTAHTTESSFFKYIRISNEEIAESVQSHRFFKK